MMDESGELAPPRIGIRLGMSGRVCAAHGETVQPANRDAESEAIACEYRSVVFRARSDDQL
jgi:hypothetical protein